MGLLDDAIREHLELKRRHGADPSEVARQEREALGPPRSAAAANEGVLASDPAPEADVAPPAYEPPEPEMIPEPPVTPAPPPGGAESLARRAAREAEEDVDLPDAATAEHRAAAPSPAPARRDDGTGAAEPPPAGPKGEGDEEEDVLEETPEFLQETPEHDRLWFEQRPPRDFDF